MKIIIDSAIPYIKNRFPSTVEEIYVRGDKITPALIKDADAMIIRTRTKCDKHLLEGSNVKLIATATIGTDHINTDWCEKNGIKVVNAPGCNAPGVAQYVLSSLMSIGFDPGKDTLGIIGYGHVGSIVAKWARKIGVKIMVSDDPRKEEGWKDEEYKPVETLLEECDAITLHVPFTTSGKFATYGMIGEKELETLKRGAILVNSSRGGVIDESALKKTIKDRGVRAVIDVWENEPHVDLELVNMASLATPHIAGYSLEGKKRATRMVLEAVKETLNIDVDLSGLKTETQDDNDISIALIANSYDPTKDHQFFKQDPTRFEDLRNNYSYRHEPLAILTDK